MSERQTDTETKTAIPSSVSFRLLGLLVLAFLLGCASYGLVQNVVSEEPLSFSTTSLIGFVLTVLLSGSSIVLAIAAITLGKFSEQAMMMRSDESIRLQNEVFQKTTDALQRIESSTGVTEKRIEDIISGRVVDLSEKIANIASGKKEAKGQLKPSELQELIKESLLEGLKEEGMIRPRRFDPGEMAKATEREAKEREEERKSMTLYRERHMELLRAFSARDGLMALKMEHGTTSGEGEDLFDGIFARNDGQKVAVTTFSSTHSPSSIREFAEHSLLEIRNGFVAMSYVVLFEEHHAQEKAYSDIVSVAAPELAARLALVVCPPNKIGAKVNELDISNKALQATSGTGPSAAPAEEKVSR